MATDRENRPVRSTSIEVEIQANKQYGLAYATVAGTFLTGLPLDIFLQIKPGDVLKVTVEYIEQG